MSTNNNDSFPWRKPFFIADNISQPLLIFKIELVQIGIPLAKIVLKRPENIIPTSIVVCTLSFSSNNTSRAITVCTKRVEMLAIALNRNLMNQTIDIPIARLSITFNRNKYYKEKKQNFQPVHQKKNFSE